MNTLPFRSSQKGSTDFVLVETGTTFGLTGWEESGQSTIMFDRFLNFGPNNGTLHSVDLDEDSCATSRSITSRKVSVTAADSVSHLGDLRSRFVASDTLIDLLYLDSWDVATSEWTSTAAGADALPATHALKELEAIRSRLRPGGIVLVDDNMPTWATTADQVRGRGGGGAKEYDRGDNVKGKGRLVAEKLKEVGCELVFWGWQVMFVC